MEHLPRTNATCSLLVVEDEPITRSILTRILLNNLRDMDIISAENGQAGLELFRQHRPAIVVTDIMMPVMDGVRMAAEILAIAPATQVIFLSANNQSQHQMELDALGISHYLQKPVNYLHLFESLDSCRTRVHELRLQTASFELCGGGCGDLA